jgi:hypothetical protein
MIEEADEAESRRCCGTPFKRMIRGAESVWDDVYRHGDIELPSVCVAADGEDGESLPEQLLASPPPMDLNLRVESLSHKPATGR